MPKRSRQVALLIQKLALGVILGICVAFLVKSNVEHSICQSVRNDAAKLNNHQHESKIALPRVLTKQDMQTKIFIGIMSTAEYIPNRMKTALDTWIPAGKWTIRVYADVEDNLLDRHNSNRNKNKISVVRLPGVDDHAYPPQKKSFMLLRDMFDSNNCANDYDWYIRVDDDSYVSYNRLNTLLSHLDPNEPIFIGKPGFGKDEDDFIEDGMTYYQGGLGMIFSRKLIQQMRPYLQTCINNMLSPHEDIEIGRCVWRHTKARYTVAYDTYGLFFQSFNKEGKRVNVERVPEDVIPRVITLHPNKEAPLTYKLHQFMRIADIKDKLVGLFSLSHELAASDGVLKYEEAKRKRNLRQRIKRTANAKTKVESSPKHPISAPQFSSKSEFYPTLGKVARLSSASLSSIVDGDSWGFFTKSDIIFNYKDEHFDYPLLGGKLRYEWKAVINNICLEFPTSSFKTLAEHISFTNGYFRMLPDRGLQIVMLFKRLKAASKPLSACVLAADVQFGFEFVDDSQSILHAGYEATKTSKVLRGERSIIRSLQTAIKQAISNFTCLSRQSEERLGKPNNVHDVLVIPFNSVDPELIKQQIFMLQQRIPCFHSLKTILIFKALTSVDFSKPVFKELKENYPNIIIVDRPKWPTSLVKSTIDFIEKSVKPTSKFSRLLIAYPGVVISNKFIEECHKWTKTTRHVWFPVVNVTTASEQHSCKNEKVLSNIIDVDLFRQRIYDSTSWQHNFYGIGCGYIADIKDVFNSKTNAKIEDYTLTDDIIQNLKITRNKITDDVAYVSNINSYAKSYMLKEQKATSRTKIYEKIQFKLYCDKKR